MSIFSYEVLPSAICKATSILLNVLLNCAIITIESEVIHIAKSYDLSNSSDMRKFTKSLENSILDKAREQASLRDYNVECPKCKQTITVKAGRNICPICQNEIDLDLEFNF